MTPDQTTQAEHMRAFNGGFNRYRLALTVACGISLIAAAGCGSSGSLDNSVPGQGPSAADSAASAQATPAAIPSTSAPADNPSGAGGNSAAVVDFKDGQGDAYTESFTFGDPEGESAVPAAVSGVTTCQLGVPDPARNLVIPVTISTTLTTSIQTQIPIQMNFGQFLNGPSGPDGLDSLAADFIYQTAAGDQCAPSNSPGATVTLNQGQTTNTQAWIVLLNAITPAHPSGDPAQLGQMFVDFPQGAATSASGPSVCNGSDQTKQLSAPPFLHIAGQVSDYEDCSGSYG